MMTGRLLSTDLPRRQQRRFSNLVSPAVAIRSPKAHSTGLAGNPHTCEAGLIQYPDVADRLGFSSLRREPCGGVLGRPRTFISLRRQPGSNTAQDITESFGSVAPQTIGSRHGNNHEGSHDRKVVNLCRGFGNVCRVGA